MTDWLIYILHKLLVGLFITAPLAAIAMDVRGARRRRRSSPSPAYVATICAGVAIGTSVSVAYAVVGGGRASVWQVVLASYFAASLLFLLKAGDHLLRMSLTQLVGRRVYRYFPDPDAPATPGIPPPMIRRETKMRRPGTLSSTLRIVVLFGLGLPYILAAGLTYRPKVIPTDDPRSRLGLDFQRVAFESTDGVRLSGWWIPAADGKRSGIRSRSRAKSASTIVICPGPGVGKTSALPLVSAFVPHGYNVLLFDFRAHGESDGQITSFGDLERRDVLGAVNWIERAHPDQSRRLYGVGIETGGAALIGAAADSSTVGQSFNAIAVFGGFNTLLDLTREVTTDNFLPPLNWLVSTIGLAMGSVQSGVNLTSFSPAQEIANVWPRPVMIVHGGSERMFPMELGRRLFESAAQPKQSRWVTDANNAQLLTDEPTARAVREFFSKAEPVPVI